MVNLHLLSHFDIILNYPRQSSPILTLPLLPPCAPSSSSTSFPNLAVTPLLPPADHKKACREAGAVAALERVKRDGNAAAKAKAEEALVKLRTPEKSAEEMDRALKAHTKRNNQIG